MRNYFISGRQILFTTVLCFFSLQAEVVSAWAQETLRQYLSGTDGEHTVPWDFFCSDGRNSGAWTNIAVPSCWELQGFGKFRYGHEDKNYTPIRGDYRHHFTMKIPDEKPFVRVGTPQFPLPKLSGKSMVNVPPGNLAVVRDIPPIGTKFHNAVQLGPQSTTPLVTAPHQSSIYLRFEPCASAPAN